MLLHSDASWESSEGWTGLDIQNGAPTGLALTQGGWTSCMAVGIPQTERSESQVEAT